MRLNNNRVKENVYELGGSVATRCLEQRLPEDPLWVDPLTNVVSLFLFAENPQISLTGIVVYVSTSGTFRE